MKANELMIRDWYQWYADGKYYQYQVKAEDFTKDYVANFEPIPLTPEILEKNGFKKVDIGDGDYRWRYYGGSYVWVSIKINKVGHRYDISYSSEPLSDMKLMTAKEAFIHELQHALRLCGLNELADNFKV